MDINLYLKTINFVQPFVVQLDAHEEQKKTNSRKWTNRSQTLLNANWFHLFIEVEKLKLLRSQWEWMWSFFPLCTDLNWALDGRGQFYFVQHFLCVSPLHAYMYVFRTNHNAILFLIQRKQTMVLARWCSHCEKLNASTFCSSPSLACRL